MCPPLEPLPAHLLLARCAVEPREARALLAHALNIGREQLVAHPETVVSPSAGARFTLLAAQRRAGMPMAYLLGVQEFYGIPLQVTPQVLVPRPETELLVDQALQLLQERPGARVLELGTGSGCIAIALARLRPDLRIVASDRSLAALRVAQANCRVAQVDVALFAADWYAPIQPVNGAGFDLIVSNPPYIAATDAHLAQLSHEPRLALTDEGDGLLALRMIIAGAGECLAPDGRLLVEHGYDQGAAVRELARSSGLLNVQTLRDLEGRERACVASRA